ncbi:unnamed protein product [Ceratitis capitata]|uniref:(Mediterranean fruit fly) hypothetical protein n=1 Tax=Ceratitis capitata TaxID=7213 RepID=A0A811U482_CERCA|nr:unnamed protein product [Ceratitis capitata]
MCKKRRFGIKIGGCCDCSATAVYETGRQTEKQDKQDGCPTESATTRPIARLWGLAKRGADAKRCRRR